MKLALSLLLLLAAWVLPQANAQEFDRLYPNSPQAALSQPLQWLKADTSAAPGLPDAFVASPQVWAPYTYSTVLPTGVGRDVWVKFSLAATPAPQTWVIRVPRVSVQRVSLYSLDAGGKWQIESAGMSLAPAAWSRKTRTPSFGVATSSSEKSYFMRFEHHSPLTERPELMSEVDFADGAARMGTLIGMAYGMYGFLIVTCVVAFAMARNSIFLWLACFIASLALHILNQMGYNAWRLWPGSSYVNNVMVWIAPLLSMATGSWFFAQASYAKDSNKAIYRLLSGMALASLLMCVVKLAFGDALPRILLNNWAALVLFVLVASLLWLGMRGMRWNLWLLAGLLPIAASGTTRLAYSYGWLAHMEFAQTASVFFTQLGLMSLFVVLVWRSRDAILSTAVANALANNDPITGLFNSRVAKIRLKLLLLRSDRLKFGCGVIMLRWVNFAKVMASQSPDQQTVMQKQFGQLLTRLVRDIDTAAVLGDGYFLLLIEGPVNRSALASLSTQILTACIRLSETFKLPHAVDLHIAIWHAELTPSTPVEVVSALQAKLGQMSPGTKRPVQFADSLSSEPEPDRAQEFTERRDELVAKINAIEASPSFKAPLMDKPSKRSRR